MTNFIGRLEVSPLHDNESSKRADKHLEKNRCADEQKLEAFTQRLGVSHQPLRVALMTISHIL